MLTDSAPAGCLLQNVPGLLSEDGGRAFGTVLGLLANLGYGFAYRVFDAQYFGYPTTPACLPCRLPWRLGPPAAVLFERHSLQGHPTPGRETWESVAACLTQGVDSQGKGGYAGRRREDDINLRAYRTSPNCGAWETGQRIDALTTGTDRTSCILAFDTTQVTSKENRSQPAPGDPCHPLTSHGHVPAISYAIRTAQTHSNGHGCAKEVAHTLDSTRGGYWRENGALRARGQESHEHLIAPIAFTERGREDGRTLEWQNDQAYCLLNPGAGSRSRERNLLDPSTQVRRLTPRECERLQDSPMITPSSPIVANLRKTPPGIGPSAIASRYP